MAATWVAEPANEVKISVIDYNGKTATTSYWVSGDNTDPAAGGPAAIASAVQDISAGKVVAVELLSRATNTTPDAAGTGSYDSVQDKALLEFVAADGSPVRLQLPGPKEAGFKSDHVTVKDDEANMAALIAAFKTNARSAEGAAITALRRGYRRTPPRIKKH